MQELQLRIERLKIHNSRPENLVFWLEPWGQDFSIPEGEEFEIVFNSSQTGSVLVEFNNNDILVYGWSGSTFAVYHKNVKLGESNCVSP